MTIRQQWAVVGAIVAVLGGGLFAATKILGSELFPVGVGTKAPSFEAAPIDGPARIKSIEDYRGEVVLLNIWATWCVPCRLEMPSMQALHERYGPRGLRIVAVSVDDAPQSEEAIREFRTSYNLGFEILHDPSRDIERIYQTSGVPQTFLIGRDGVIRKKVIGATNWNSSPNRALVALLLGVAGDTAALLREPTPTPPSR